MARALYWLITAVWLSGFAKIIYQEWMGRSQPEALGWWNVFLFALPVAGFIREAAAASVRLRLHPLATPIGVALLAWQWTMFVVVDCAAAPSVGAALLRTSNTFSFVSALGLALALVDGRSYGRGIYLLFPFVAFWLHALINALVHWLAGVVDSPAVPLDDVGTRAFLATHGRIISTFLNYAAGVYWGVAILGRLRRDHVGWRRPAAAAAGLLAAAAAFSQLVGRLPPPPWVRGSQRVAGYGDWRPPPVERAKDDPPVR